MSTKLTIKPLKQKDAGRGLAAVDRRSMQELDLENGDYILIKGGDGERAVARVWPGYPDDQGQSVIRIDGQLRSEAQVGIDDRVTAECEIVEDLGENRYRLRTTVRDAEETVIDGEAVVMLDEP